MNMFLLDYREDKQGEARLVQHTTRACSLYQWSTRHSKKQKESSLEFGYRGRSYKHGQVGRGICETS